MFGELFFGWLIIAFLFLILEISSPGLFFFLPFFIGAVGSVGLTLLTDNLALQLITFLLCSLFSCVDLHLWVKKSAKQRRGYSTNVQALIGKQAVIIKTIEAHRGGQVKVQGEIWSARSLNNEEIKEGMVVEVVAVRGVHLLVKNK